MRLQPSEVEDRRPRAYPDPKESVQAKEKKVHKVEDHRENEIGPRETWDERDSYGQKLEENHGP